MTKKVAVRQGDVFILPVSDIPQSAKAVAPENGRLIVARGEATGHHHSFPWARGATLFRDDGAGSGTAQYVRVETPIALEHQEHSALQLPSGNYKVVIQRMMKSGLVRRVED